MKRLPFVLFLTLTLPVSAANADVLHVPGTHVTLQEAIDVALPGDKIMVHGGAHDPIVIDKPLTLVGDPRATIRFNDSHGPVNPNRAPTVITLAGSGSGTVRLSNFLVYSGSDPVVVVHGEPTIAGGGFDELQIHDSEIHGWDFLVPSGDCCSAGRAALATDIPQVLVSSSTLIAGFSDSGYCGPMPPTPEPGILAPASAVTVLDSTVEGGGIYWGCAMDDCWTDAELLGVLQPAVTAASTYFSVGSIAKGGSIVHNLVGIWSLGGFEVESCGIGPTQVGFGGPFPRLLPLDLQEFGPLAVGELWTLYWATPGQFQVLYLSRAPRLPPIDTVHGLEFLDFSVPILPRVFAGAGPTAWSEWIPLNVNLVGLPLTAQVFDTQSGYTRPIIRMIAPGVLSTPPKLRPAPIRLGS